MPPAAQLGTGQVKNSSAVCMKPGKLPHSRYQVLLDPQVRQEETVQHVLTLDLQHHVLVHRYMQVIHRVKVIRCAICWSGPA